MKTLKKLSAILLALGLVAGFAACGGKSGDKSEGNGSETTSETVSVGEEISQTEFEAAVQALYGLTNVQIVITDGEQTENGETKSLEGKVSFADGKVYREMTYKTNGVSETEYSYVGAVDGTYYEWTSSDKNVWEYSTVDENAAAPLAFLEGVFTWCNFTYYEYNTKENTMEFPNFSGERVNVKVVDGKISEYRFEDKNGNWYLATITSGNATVGELPTLD